MVEAYTENFDTIEICPNEDYPVIADDILLTHDRIPVRKIMVANIKSWTTHKDLKKKFIKYGEVIDCCLKRKRRSKKSYAFITFEDAKSALRAINAGFHRKIEIDGQYLRVLPAAAWHQPDRNQLVNNISPNVSETEENLLAAYNHYFSNDESPITKLNEHCLLHIFRFLPVRNIISIERVCRYWQIVSRHALHLYDKFNFILSRENWQYIRNAPTLYTVLTKFGSYITKINDLNNNESIGNCTLIAIAKLCPNVVEINLKNFPYLASGIKALAKNLVEIKSITIGSSSHDYWNYFDSIRQLSALLWRHRNIEKFQALNRDITIDLVLKHLSTKHITRISLYNQNCFSFARIFSKIPNLFTLDICACVNEHRLFNDQRFKLNAENIEKLTLVKYASRDTINENLIHDFLISSNLKNLKHLNLRCDEYSTAYCNNRLLFTLGARFNDQLTYLNVTGNRKLRNSGLVCIITSLSNLEHFHMAEMNETVTDEIFCCGMPNLRTLNCSLCSGIRDEGLITFIQNSEKLEKLDVTYCDSITNKLILAAAEYTKHKNNKIILSIDASSTAVNINANDLQEYPYLKVKQGRRMV